jgi:hypothetical protein
MSVSGRRQGAKLPLLNALDEDYVSSRLFFEGGGFFTFFAANCAPFLQRKIKKSF